MHNHKGGTTATTLATPARLKIIQDALNKVITPKQFEKAMKKDPELRKLWDNRTKRIDKEDDT